MAVRLRGYPPHCECCPQCLIGSDNFNAPPLEDKWPSYDPYDWVEENGVLHNLASPAMITFGPESEFPEVGMVAQVIVKLLDGTGTMRVMVAKNDDDNYLFAEIRYEETYGDLCAVLQIGVREGAVDTYLDEPTALWQPPGDAGGEAFLLTVCWQPDLYEYGGGTLQAFVRDSRTPTYPEGTEGISWQEATVDWSGTAAGLFVGEGDWEFDDWFLYYHYADLGDDDVVGQPPNLRVCPRCQPSCYVFLDDFERDDDELGCHWDTISGAFSVTATSGAFPVVPAYCEVTSAGRAISRHPSSDASGDQYAAVGVTMTTGQSCALLIAYQDGGDYIKVEVEHLLPSNTLRLRVLNSGGATLAENTVDEGFGYDDISGYLCARIIDGMLRASFYLSNGLDIYPGVDNVDVGVVAPGYAGIEGDTGVIFRRFRQWQPPAHEAAGVGDTFCENCFGPPPLPCATTVCDGGLRPASILLTLSGVIKQSGTCCVDSGPAPPAAGARVRVHTFFSDAINRSFIIPAVETPLTNCCLWDIDYGTDGYCSGDSSSVLSRDIARCESTGWFTGGGTVSEDGRIFLRRITVGYALFSGTLRIVVRFQFAARLRIASPGQPWDCADVTGSTQAWGTQVTHFRLLNASGGDAPPVDCGAIAGDIPSINGCGGTSCFSEVSGCTNDNSLNSANQGCLLDFRTSTLSLSGA